jgi:L-2,4-diaminobutyrate decarboxylase
LKILVSLRVTGRRRLARHVEHLVELAARAGELVDEHRDLELVAPPQTVTVLFRCRRPDSADPLDAIDAHVHRELLASGRPVIGRTIWRGEPVLKLTLVNPLTTADDLAQLLDLVASTARAVACAGRPEEALTT